MKKRYTFTLDLEVVKQAKKLAIDKNMSLSALIESLLKEETRKPENRIGA